MNSKRSYPLRTWLARLARLALVPIWLVATAHAARADHFCGYLSSEWVNHGKNPICNDLQSFYTYHVYSYCCTGRLLYDNVIANSCHYPWSISPPPSQGECVATQVPCPECDEVGETCDGIDEPGATRADDQCGDDEEGCAGRNRDGNPVRYEDGSVESQVHVLAAVPGNGALGLNYAIQYQSRLGRRPAGATADFFKDQHFLGHGWSDSFSDRLIVPTEPGESSVWMSLDRTVSFDPADAGDSDGGRYHLTDRGATQSPRWVIESRERGTVKQTWEFNDASTHPSGPRRGLLVGRSATGFRLDIARVSATDSRITTVIDSLGRRLTFTYQATTGASWIWRLDHVTYQTMLGTTATTIAQFSYGTSHRLDEVATPTDYLRFNYLDDYPTPCAHCEALLTEIIAPASADGASPLPGTPPQPHERVIEGHAFEVLGDGTPRAVESWGPTTHWAYQYVDGAATRQLDLLQPKEACPSGTCPDGQACQTTAADPDGTCYVVNIRDLIDGSVWNVDRGGLPDENESYIYDGDTPIATYARGIITSYRFNDDGTIRCLVRNDDDTEALDEQGQCGNTATGDLVQVLEPSWSVGPGGAEIHDVTLPSALVAGGTRSSTDWYDEHGLRSLHQRWGWTQDRAGVTWPRAEATRYDYDAIGRLVRIDGPLDNNEAYDVVETEYHGAGPDLGHVRYSRRFSGTEWVHTTFTTEYLEYDLRGIPHRIVGPDGVETRLATPDGLSWTATEDATGSPVVSTIELNPDGSVRSQVDADGVCLTYQIDARAARMITKRSDLSVCGVLPIDLDHGDVIIIEHAPGDPGRTQRIEQRRDGEVVQLLDGFRYDDGRRLVGVPGANVSGEFVTTYTDALMSQITAPGWPSDGAWRSSVEADELARPTALRRLKGDGTAAVTRLLYDSAWDGTPTQVTHGQDTAIAQLSSFRYDDFDRLVEATTPDAGTTRWEHDGAGRRIFERVGVGTPDEQTTRTSYDSLGRVLAVERDVDASAGSTCGTAPDGTPLANETYVYDDCSYEYHPDPSFRCERPLGRLAVARRDLYCQGGEAVAQVRWYQYGPTGRLMGTRTSLRTGTSYDGESGLDYAWSPGGRLLRYAIIGTDQGTRYSYSATGGVTDVAATDRTPIATNVTYSVSGAPLGYTLVDDATTPYAQLSREYDQQGMLRRHAWLALGVAAWQDQVFKYNDAGMLMTVTDAGAPAHGRRYEYDRLARMTCEVAGDPETSGACATSNPAVLGRFTYHDGASTSAPPAHRATMFTRTPYHAATAAESAAYTPWTNRAQSVQRGNDTLVITYDGLGRRTADYLASQPVASRRDYAYSPDGHLHTTTTSAGTVTLTYGIGGELMSIAGPAETAALVYDDGGRLVAAQVITDGTELDWEYHYLGDLPIAATRRRDLGDGPTADRLGFLHDRRGLITHVVTTKGDSLYEADHDAAGVASVDRHARFLWMPFALPGQLVLADTAATGRGPLAANGARAYDADLGIFLAPDPADPVARIVPEGYAYARNNPLHFADPSGGAAMTYWDTDDHPFYGPERTFFVDQGCDPAMAQMVRAALRQAITAIASCTDGACGPLGGTALRARWLYSLSVGRYACENRETKTATYGPLSYKFVNGTLPGHGAAFTDAGAVAGNKRMQGLLRQKVTFLGSDISLMCLAGNLAHEALHPALLSLDAHDLHAPQRPEWAEVFLAGAAMVDSRRVTRSERAAGAVDSEYPNSSFTGDTEPQNYQQPDEAYIKNAVKRCGLCD